MQKLALVIDIVDVVSEAAERDEPFDAKQEARRLVYRHPEAEVSVGDVEKLLEEEVAAAEVTINR
jgi:hypothetical protein